MLKQVRHPYLLHEIKLEGAGAQLSLRLPQQHPFLWFVDHTRIPQLFYVVHLLPEDRHGSTVTLDGLEPFW